MLANTRLTSAPLRAQKATRLNCTLMRQLSADTTSRLLSRLLESSPHIVYKSGQVFFQQCGVLCRFLSPKICRVARSHGAGEGGVNSLTSAIGGSGSGSG